MSQKALTTEQLQNALDAFHATGSKTQAAVMLGLKVVARHRHARLFSVSHQLRRDRRWQTAF